MSSIFWYFYFGNMNTYYVLRNSEKRLTFCFKKLLFNERLPICSKV